MAGAHVARPDNCHARSPHAGRLGTGRHHSWRLVDDGDLRTLAASLAALVDDSSNMSWKPSPSTWTWHDGQRRERRRQDEHLQLEAASSGGGGTGRRQDLVVNKCVLTVGFWERNNVHGKGLRILSRFQG